MSGKLLGIHFDYGQLAIIRVDGELDIGAAGVYSYLANDLYSGVAHDLVFAICKGLGGSNGNRVAGVDAHRVKVFDGTDYDNIVCKITHYFEFIFFPSGNGALD